MKGFEPSASASQMRRSDQAELHPDCVILVYHTLFSCQTHALEDSNSYLTGLEAAVFPLDQGRIVHEK